jgi:Zn-dependent protease
LEEQDSANNNGVDDNSNARATNEAAVYSYFTSLGNDETPVSEIRATSLHDLRDYYSSEEESDAKTQNLNPEPPQDDFLTIHVPQKPELQWRKPLILYLLTWICVCWAGSWLFGLTGGLLFAFCVMLILTCHEMGHYLQSRRYRVSASLPYFIPLPPIISLFGTMGAIIRMDGRIPNRRALFDIGISGPLAGLAPTLIFCVIGVKQAYVVPGQSGGYQLGDPLFMTWLTRFFFGEIPDDLTLYLNSVGMAGWFGLFLTTLNLFPIGQLDGGHVFYAILGKRAPDFSMLLFTLIVAYVIISQHYFWILMLILLWLMNPKHPPTQNDAPKIGAFRTILGWATLAFIIIGFTLTPITYAPEEHSEPAIVQSLENNEEGLQSNNFNKVSSFHFKKESKNEKNSKKFQA